MIKHKVMCPSDTQFSSTTTTISRSNFASIVCAIALIFPLIGLAQIGDHQKYTDFSSTGFYDFEILQDLKYGAGKTKYQKLNQSGSYETIDQINLELDLFVPETPSSKGKRAVIIMIPGSGRGGCRDGIRYLPDGSINTSIGCTQKTLLDGSKVTQEGLNYNHLNNAIASQYAKRGFIVASVNTRYNYQHTDFVKNGSNRWFRTADGVDDGSNPGTLVNLASAHLEYMVVDLKRAMRWLTANADVYNLDPNYIFITGASGAAKMAALTGITNENQLNVDDPANINTAFETTHNNWDIRNSTPGIKGVILRKGDTNGLINLRLMDTMSANTDSFLLWTGTADKSILQGMSEIIEEKCEILQTCSAQLISLPNKTHSSSSSATYPHPKLGNQNSTTHTYDFMVDAIHKDSENLPVISLSQSQVSFDEDAGNAQIRIIRSGSANSAITFTVSADQMREVTLENGSGGTFDLITKYVAKSSNSDGLVMYNESTGYVYEDAFGGDLRKTSDKVVTHTSGKGIGEYTEISSGDNQYHDIDFTGKTQIMTMAAGQTSMNFNVAIEDDTLSEDNECFKVRLLSADGATIGNSVETITIIDNDSSNPSSNEVCSNHSYNGNFEPNPVISFSTAQTSIAEGESRSLIIKSNRTVTENISVSYTTTQGSASTADFGSMNGIAVIPAGQSQTTINVQTTQDSRVELNEKFTVDLIDITGGEADIGSVSSTVITILDDDETAVVTIGPSSKSVNEGSAVTFTVSSSLVLSQDVSFEYQTRASSASVDDFQWQKETATIAAGGSSVNISINTTEDFLVEGTEMFRVDLNNITAGSASIGSADSSQVNIIDNDSLPKISIGPANRTVTEGGTVALTIQSDRNVTQAISVQYQTLVGSASVDDFTWVRRSVQIPAGRSSVDIEIETTNDINVESNETFNVELREITSGDAELDSAISSRITIRDNDVLPNISFATDTKGVREGDDATIKIESDQAVNEAISVEYQTRVYTASTSDFVWINRTAVIPAGETSTNIVIETIDDNIDEINEEFTVTLNNVNGEARIVSPDTIRVTITDNDEAKPTIIISPVITSVDEGDSVSLTISSDKVVATNVRVEYQTQVASASTQDFVWVKKVAVIPGGSKSIDISINTIEDNINEEDETFLVTLNQIVSGSAVIGSNRSSEIKILDDDELTAISIFPQIRTVSEGDRIDLTISADKNATEAITVEYQTRVISASTQDFVWVQKNAVIPVGSQSVDISISTTEDQSIEPDETFTVNLNKVVKGNAMLGSVITTTLTILDDETQPVISFLDANKIVEEGDSVVLTLVADRETQNNVAIRYQTKVASATTRDFEWVSDTVIMPRGSTQASIRIDTIDDDKNKESAEEFTVVLNQISYGWAKLGSKKTAKITIEQDLCEIFMIPLKGGKVQVNFCL